MKTKILITILSGASIATGNAAATVELNNIYAKMPVYLYETGKLATDPNVLYVMIYSSGVGEISHTLYKSGTTGNNAGDYVFTVDENGYFDGGTGVVPGVIDNSIVDMTMVAWLGDASGPTMSPAGIRGYSATWWQKTGSWNPNSGTAATGPELLVPNSVIVGSSVVPEPQTPTLAIVGGVALFVTSKGFKLFRRHR